MRPEYQLNEQFANSDYGLILDNSVRFGTFKPDFIANEEWVEMLGEDVNNRTHMMRAYKLTRWAMSHEDLSPLDKERMGLAAMVHDWGEAIVGDTPDPLKTAEGERLERIAWGTVASSLLGKHKAMELAIATDSIVFPQRQNKLSRLWRAIEYMGYFETARKAAEQAGSIDHWEERFDLSGTQSDLLLGSLRNMGSQVCSVSLVKLQPYKDFNSVRNFLHD